MPVCETLAHLTVDAPAVATLVVLAGEARPAPVSLAAVNALTRLDLELVRPHRDVVEAAAVRDETPSTRPASQPAIGTPSGGKPLSWTSVMRPRGAFHGRLPVRARLPDR
ncbi:hypothetical protein AB0H18_38070 [Streptomyces sp. NPDC020766]|uniref:hypothetical protein n=1 Tax=Streptomyces sp. NPDC020766 TaxID=3155011 RepID=UPI0033DAF4BD